MKVLVTGGSGFIGRAVVDNLLSRGHQAIRFDRAHGEIQGDIMRVSDLDAASNIDALIHLAGILGTAELFDQVETAVDINVRGTVNVLNLAHRAHARYVGITMPDLFPSIYTATKVCADRLASAYHNAYGLPVCHVRAFNAYGRGQKFGPTHPQKIVPTFAVAAWSGKPIPVWGDGEQTVDLVHVDDLGRLLVDGLSHGDDVTLDGGTGLPLSVNEVASMVLDITGSRAGVRYLPMRRGEQPTKVVATGSGWDRLDWKPTFSPELFAEAVHSYRDLSRYANLAQT